MAQPTIDKQQLRKMLLVALSSDQPGEVMAALTKVKGALAKAGLDVHWLVEALTLKPMPQVVPDFWAQAPVPMVDWKVMLAEVCDLAPQLKRREREFVESLMTQWSEKLNWHPTDRQLTWLADIYTRFRR